MRSCSAGDRGSLDVKSGRNRSPCAESRRQHRRRKIPPATAPSYGVDDLEGRRRCRCAQPARTDRPLLFSRPEEEECSRRSTAWPVRRVGRSSAAASPEAGAIGHHRVLGWRLVTRVKRRIGKGQWRFIAGDDDTTAPRSGCKPPSGHSPALVAHATVTRPWWAGSCPPAGTSPPPVSRSKGLVAFASAD